MKYLLLLGSALAVGTPAFAEEADNTVVVTATRFEAPLSQVGQSVSVVERDEIERVQATTATDVLRRLPGVSVVRSGGFGQPSSVFIRGADNAQSLVLIDGVRINDPGDVGGSFDFGTLAIGEFERVEVVRGSSGVLWGSRALGGVINFITARPTREWTARAQAEYGWRDHRQLGASVSGLVGPVSLSVGGSWLKSDGYSAFSERRGATEKDGFESRSANVRADVELVSGLSVEAGGYYTKGNYDFDNTGADALNVGMKRDTVGYANLRYKSLDGRLAARVGYGVTDTRRISDDALYGPYETDGRNDRAEGQVSFSPIEMVSIVAGAETETSKFSDNFGSRDKASMDSYFGTLTVRPSRALTINGGLRYDEHANFGSRTTFAANGAWVLGGDDAPVLRASYGEGFRAPSLYQLYTNRAYTALEPEESTAWDVGIEQPFAEGKGRLTLTWFDRKTRNLIDYDLANFNYYNIGRTRAKGIEFGMTVSGWQGFDVSLAYTYVDARNVVTDARLARRPENNFHLSIDRTWEMGLSLGAELRVGGSRYDDQANSQFVDGHVVADLRAAYQVSPAVEIYGRVENVFDEHYELVRTYGTPGRSAYGGVRVKI